MTSDPSNIASRWWTPSVYSDRRPFLTKRQAITRAVRDHFCHEGFAEVETAILQISPGNEAHIAGFATSLRNPSGSESSLFLHSSPEFACKKLLAAGERHIFTLAKVFRNGERGPLHHPEFTMLEWYRTDPYEMLITDIQRLLAVVAQAADTKMLAWRGGQTDPFGEFERLSVAEAFSRYAALDLLATFDDALPNRDRLASEVAQLGIRVSGDDSWSDLFSKVLSDRIEPNLGFGRPTILMNYPACEAALARVDSHDPRLAERFEVYACGVELANAFGELTDPAEQRRRFQSEMNERERIYGERYPIDEDFLSALAFMPEASGIAVGFDRMVMLACGATHIEHVLWTPVEGHR